MICDCGSDKTERNGKCASCNRMERKAAALKLPDDPKPIAKQSDEMKRMMALYVRKKAKWIKGKKCAVLKNVPATDVHHSAGRGIHSYYDEYAQERGICLLMDDRFWIPVSREGHIEIERRPEWARKMGFTEDRLILAKVRSENQEL